MPVVPWRRRRIASVRSVLSPAWRRLAVGGVALAALGACAGGDEAPASSVDAATTAPDPGGGAPNEGSGGEDVGDGSVPSGSSPSAEVAALFEAFGSALVRLTTAAGETLALCMIAADEPEERSRGLMGVSDLSGADGMLFVNEAERAGQFYMFRTLIPLTVGWWDDDGAYAGQTDMVPCESDDSADCLRYPTPSFRYAVEVGVDDPLGDAFAGSRLEVDGGSCHTS